MNEQYASFFPPFFCQLRWCLWNAADGFVGFLRYYAKPLVYTPKTAGSKQIVFAASGMIIAGPSQAHRGIHIY